MGMAKRDVVKTGVEMNNSPRRCISVVKSRGSHHSSATRELETAQRGTSFLPVEASLLHTLPLRGYSSLLCRAPAGFSRLVPTNGAAHLMGTE